MPLMLNKEALCECSDDTLKDQKWFSEKIVDVIYSPGMTQKLLEENVMTLRECYIEKNLDGVFLDLFSKISGVYRERDALKDTGLMLRVPYTKEDFMYSKAPFQEISQAKNAFHKGQLEMQLEEQAERVGIPKTKFRKLLNEFSENMDGQVYANNTINFPLCPGGKKVEIDIGKWHIDRTGIWRDNGSKKEYACLHAIAPVGRLTNIDTGEEKLVIAFDHNGRFRHITKPKLDLFDSKKVVNLAGVGVAVTSRMAAALSDFLNDVETLNYTMIPGKDSVSRLGFMSDGSFSPYTDGIVFDGEGAFGTLFESITQKGNYEKWLECAIRCRAGNKIAHTVLAASFASVLICKLGGLSFFVHLWGGGSGTGKTVALMLAASVWGNPEIGTYPQTFNATQVGHEKTAAFLNNLPMCIDELQLTKDSHGHVRFDVYQLAQGVGRTRGNKTGGIDRTPTWKLCVISTGESQIVGTNAGAGAVNRVIDIECKPVTVERVIEDGIGTSRILKQNYGHAGRKFVESLTDDKIEEAEKLYSVLFAELCDGETTEKQAMAAAMILTADRMADDVIFQTGNVLTTDDIAEFLQTKEDVSIGKRGYDFLCGWITKYASYFGDESKERYGKIDGDYAYIIRNVYNEAMSDAQFDGKAVLSWMDAQGLIMRDNDGKHLTRKARIGSISTRCVVVKVDSNCTDHDIDDYDDLTIG